MRQKKGFVMRNVCGDNVIVGEGIEQINFNKLLTLNDTAAFLWEEAGKGDFTVESLVEALTQQYDVDSDIATADVKRLIDKWLDMGLIEN
ncbi:MAG: PqqD family protein [Bacteroidaceae bacterium]|nr:PqqD family protein [Bacteroidaceae bacterium]